MSRRSAFLRLVRGDAKLPSKILDVLVQKLANADIDCAAMGISDRGGFCAEHW